MEEQMELYKGEEMEEKLREYFLEAGYYVLRSVKYKYLEEEITDVDLFLYGRFASLTRQKINVDIKNKKTPKAFERILWANGLKQLLKFDYCIVATSDKRPKIREYGKKHNTIILDGTFLSKVEGRSTNRISEEDFLKELSKYISNKQFGYNDWKTIYESSKSRLLDCLDFSGFNATLSSLQYFLESSFNYQKNDIASRTIYIIISHLLLIIDYIIKDVAFLGQKSKEAFLDEGFKYGNLGKEGVDKKIELALKISNANETSNSIMKQFESLPTNIFTEFFSKNENSKYLFSWAREFEGVAFKLEFIYPDKLDNNLKSIISIFLDYFNINRKEFFEFNNR
jgi:hypothetical protein